MKTRDVCRLYYGSGGPASKRKNNPQSTEVTSTIAAKDDTQDTAKSISNKHNDNASHSDTPCLTSSSESNFTINSNIKNRLY